MSWLPSAKQAIRYITAGMMMFRYQGGLRFLVKQGKDVSGANTICITALDDPNLYTCSEEVIRLMTNDSHVIVKNDHKPVIFQANDSYRLSGALMDKVYIRHLEQDEMNFPTFAQFLDVKIRQTTVISHLIMYLFISTMRPFNCNAREKSKNWRKDV